MANYEQTWEALRDSPEPWAVAIGGPRNEDLVFTEMLSTPEVDGGGIDPLPELEALIKPRFDAIINGREYHIASAFVNRETYEQEDAYIYTVTFSVFV